MTIEDICTKDLIVMNSDSSLFDIAIKMKQYDIGFIPISKEKKIIGVITDRDIITRAISNMEDSKGCVEGYITKNVFSINCKSSIEDAIKMMGDKKVKRLLVTKGKKVTGVISLGDIVENIDGETLKNSLIKLFEIKRNIDIFHTEVDEFYL